jgi:hypothetical protein
LRNRPPEPYAGLPGQELIDPEYRPPRLPGYLTKIRETLFGTNPDRVGMDLRLRQYMTVLQATELFDYVIATDPRVTYIVAMPPAPALEFDFTPTVQGKTDLYLSGAGPTDDGSGALAYSWDIRLVGGQLTVEQQGPRAMVWPFGPVTFVSGLSEPTPLPGSGYTVRFHAGPDTAWTVSCLARPGLDPGQVLAALDTLGDDALIRLFGTPPAGDYHTWFDLWDSPLPLPYRLGAVLLAVAARTDEARRGR